MKTVNASKGACRLPQVQLLSIPVKCSRVSADASQDLDPVSTAVYAVCFRKRHPIPAFLFFE